MRASMRKEMLHHWNPSIKRYCSFPTITDGASLGTGSRVSKRYILCRISFILFHSMACFL
uniref:Uncharacterized protein n=1 Tax=Arundo donax TaxID=35708 RepID=A0A0A9EWD3_ARUDO